MFREIGFEGFQKIEMFRLRRLEVLSARVLCAFEFGFGAIDLRVSTSGVRVRGDLRCPAFD